MDIWKYPDTVTIPDESIIGYDVEATDGKVGTVESASHDPDDSFIVVDSGFWIFGTTRTVPASLVRQFSVPTRTVFLSVDKEQLKGVPEHDDSALRHDPAIRDQFAKPDVGPKL